VRFKVMRKFATLTAFTLLALVVWGVVALAGAESVTWDPSDNDAPEGMIVQELALPSLPSPGALPRERVERVSAEPLCRSHCSTVHVSTSCGVPAKTGKDLLTHLAISRT